MPSQESSQISLGLIHRVISAGFSLRRSHFHIIQAARHDQIENAQVVSDIYCDAVIGYESRHPYADRGDFLFADPQAWGAFPARGGQAQRDQQFGADCLQRPDVLANSQAQLLQLQNRVADQLARIVSRSAAASAYLHDVNMLCSQMLAADTQFVEALPGAKGYYRGVLNDQDGVWYLLSLSLAT